MKRFLVLTCLILTGCSGSLEHLVKNIEEDEAIVFGRVKVTSVDGRDITNLCKIAIKDSRTKNYRVRTPSTRIQGNGLYVAKVPLGGVNLNYIQCTSAKGRRDNINIRGMYFEASKARESYYAGDLMIKLAYTTKGQPGTADITIVDGFDRTLVMYKSRINNHYIDSISWAKWQRGSF